MNKIHMPVAETIEVAHATLLKELHRLDEDFRGVPGEEMPELVARLEAIDRDITEHFRFEEKTGYMEMVRKIEPYQAQTIKRLIEEHHDLTRSLEALIEEARTAARVNEAFRAGLRKWINHIQRHEAWENKLQEVVCFRFPDTAD